MLPRKYHLPSLLWHRLRVRLSWLANDLHIVLPLELFAAATAFVWGVGLLREGEAFQSYVYSAFPFSETETGAAFVAWGLIRLGVVLFGSTETRAWGALTMAMLWSLVVHAIYQGTGGASAAVDLFSLWGVGANVLVAVRLIASLLSFESRRYA